MEVLIADDDRTVTRILQHWVHRYGHNADVAFDGLDAWRKLNEKRYDLFITDCFMPGMSGMELSRAIQQAGMEVQIVMVSSSDNPADMFEAKECGIDAYYIKPIKPSAIHTALESVDSILAGLKSDRALQQSLRARKASRY